MGAMSKLRDQEKSKIREQAEKVEARSGVQVLAFVTGKSDNYPEIPWKAFSLGVALASLGITAGFLLGMANPARLPLLWATVPSGLGMCLALATILLQPAARWFLGKERAAGETKQFAQSIFLGRNLSRTRSRRAVLVLVSKFERRSAIVADQGLVDRIPAAELDRITIVIDDALDRGTASAALSEGLTELERLLLARGFSAGDVGDEIADEILETEGPKS